MPGFGRKTAKEGEEGRVDQVGVREVSGVGRPRYRYYAV